MYTKDRYLEITSLTTFAPPHKNTPRKIRKWINQIRRRELARLGIPLTGRRPKVVEKEETEPQCGCNTCRYVGPSNRSLVQHRGFAESDCYYSVGRETSN